MHLPDSLPDVAQKLLLGLALAGLAAPLALADTFVVTTTADAGPGSLRQALLDAGNLPGPDVIDLTGVSGTISLAAPLASVSEAVDLVGPGAELLSLDGGGVFRPLRLQGPGPFTLSDLTLANGLSDASGLGGALQLSQSSAALSSLLRCHFVDSTAQTRGGGAYLSSPGDVLVEDCVFSGNTTVANFGDGGGLHVNVQGLATISGCSFSGNGTGSFGAGAGLYVDADAVVSDCSFTANVSGPFGNAGGLKARGTALLMQRCDFTGNVADGRGGAVELDAQSVLVEECTFVDNQADRAAVYLRRGTLIDCLIQGNTAQNEGAGLNHDSGDAITLVGCTFDANRSERNGGGLTLRRGLVQDCVFTGNSTGEQSPNARGYSGAAVEVLGSGPSEVTLERCRFEDNLADAGAVLAPRFNGSAPGPRIVLRDCLMRDNLARRRGGVLDTADVGQTRIDLVNCTLVGNQCSGPNPAPNANVPADGGGAISQIGAHVVRLTHCTVVGNTAARLGGGVRTEGFVPLDAGSGNLTGQALPGVFLEDGSTPPVGGATLINCLVAGNHAGRGPDVWGQLLGEAVGRNLIADPRGASGLKASAITGIDVAQQPQFGLLADNGGALPTVLLVAGSLAVDAGDPAGAVDADGVPLAFDARGDGFPRVVGRGVDLGATEAGSLAPPTLAGFSTIGATLASVPLTVGFVDESSAGALAWHWDFGDGASSTLQQPVHTYTVPGIYTVALTVEGPFNSDSEVKLHLIVAEQPYTDLGFALAGSFGTPQLQGVGELLGGTADTLVLTQCPAHALTTLYLGASQIDQAFKGGVLVPAPDDALMLMTDGSGGYVGPLAIPDEAPGTAFFLQAWIEDAGAPQGVSASNALRATIQ